MLKKYNQMHEQNGQKGVSNRKLLYYMNMISLESGKNAIHLKIRPRAVECTMRQNQGKPVLVIYVRLVKRNYAHDFRILKLEGIDNPRAGG